MVWMLKSAGRRNGYSMGRKSVAHTEANTGGSLVASVKSKGKHRSGRKSWKPKPRKKG